ncbi:hypothetical protein V8C34DRAFT_241019 [Trichoderma compactum]
MCFSFLIMLYFPAASFVCFQKLSLVSHLLFVFLLPFFFWLRYPQRVDHWHQKPHATTSFNVLLPAISSCLPSFSLFRFSFFFFSFFIHPLLWFLEFAEKWIIDQKLKRRAGWCESGFLMV